MSTPPIQPPPTPEQEYLSAGITPERLAAFAAMQNAQSPAEYAAAAAAAGLTGQAQQALAGQLAAGVPAGPVQAPSFEEQLEEYKKRNAALELQVGQLGQQFSSQLAQLQQALLGVQAAVPQKVDPVTESAAKVARAFGDVIAHDAKNILRSALHSHFVALGLGELAKLI